MPPIEIVSDYPPDEFLVGVQEVQERIRAGWVYQVNLSHRFHFDARGVDPLVCYERLREVNPSPFFGIIESEGQECVAGTRPTAATSTSGARLGGRLGQPGAAVRRGRAGR